MQVRAQPEVAKRGGYAYNVALEQDPKAVLQTGPGVPGWTWRSYSLTWSGPVGRDHTMRLFLLSPGMNRLLTLVRLALLAAFGFVLLTGRWPALPRRPRPEPLAALLAVLLFPAGGAGPAGDAEPRDPPGAAPAPHAPRALRAPLRHDPEPRPPPRRQPARR